MAPRRLLIAFGLLSVLLVITSHPQRVGDAREYVAMAVNLAQLRPPALSAADGLRIQGQLEHWGFGGPPLSFPQLRQAGRQDFFHFWFYSALAVPGIWLTSLAGLHPNHAFAALNVLLFLAAVRVAATRLPWWLTALVFCSPAIWWIDKSHTEMFTFSLVAIACTLLREAPWWSVFCLGLAATQNLPIAAAMAAVVMAAPALRPGAWRTPGFWTVALCGCAVALLHPIYYGWRWRVPTPQILQGTHARVPTLQEFGAVLWDVNIGLAWHAPLLVLMVAAALALIASRARVRPIAPDVWLALGTAGLFLLAFAQTTNVNNGATPGMSRYAVWLIPLAIPIVRHGVPLAGPATQRWLIPAALASCVWSLVAFHPARQERYLEPTWAADLLWTHRPALDNPYPEIFAERVSGQEPAPVPSATPDCGKVLLIEGRWPVPCVPQPVPPACRSLGALCYANRDGARYAFAGVPAPAGSYIREAHGSWSWDLASATAVGGILARVRWQDLRRVGQDEPDAMLLEAREVSWADALQSDAALLVYVREPREGATLTLRLPGAMAGALFDPETGVETRAIPRIDDRPRSLTSVSLPAGRETVLVLARSHRQGGAAPR